MQENNEQQLESKQVEDWPNGATVKLIFIHESGASGDIGWAKRNDKGCLVSAYSLLPLDSSQWDVVEERMPAGTPAATLASQEQDAVLRKEVTEAVKLFERNFAEIVTAVKDGDLSLAQFPRVGDIARVELQTRQDTLRWVLEMLPSLSRLCPQHEQALTATPPEGVSGM